MKKFDTRLYFITDSTNYTEKEFLYRVESALSGGVTLLQLREKEKTTREYMELAEKVHRIAREYDVPLIIDDRVDVALAVDAEGVHLGAADMPVLTARKKFGFLRVYEDAVFFCRDETGYYGLVYSKHPLKALHKYQDGKEYHRINSLWYEWGVWGI